MSRLFGNEQRAAKAMEPVPTASHAWPIPDSLKAWQASTKFMKHTHAHT